MADENKYNIKIECGTDFVLPFVWTDDNGNPYNLTGATVTAQLREYSGSPDALDFVCTHNNAGGRIMLIMPNEVTKQITYSYGVYDVHVTLASGVVKEPLYGDAKIQDEVTKPLDGTMLYMIGVSTYEDLPTVGILNRMYFCYDDRKIYRWNGTNYIATAVGNGIQDITYLDGGTYRMVFDDGTYFDFESVPRVIDTYDSSQAYQKLDIVHANNGATYIALVPVPANTEITNTDYWMQITPKTLTIGTVTEVGPGYSSASIGGTADAPVLNLALSRGESGNETIDDTKGAGDTDYVWSANKCTDVKDTFAKILDVTEITTGWTDGSYYILSGDGVDGEEPTGTSDHYKCICLSCAPGEKYIVTAKGASSARCWAFLSAISGDDNVISKETSSTSSSGIVNKEIIAPYNAKYLLVNVNTNNPSKLLKQGFRSAINTGGGNFDDFVPSNEPYGIMGNKVYTNTPPITGAMTGLLFVHKDTSNVIFQTFIQTSTGKICTRVRTSSDASFRSWHVTGKSQSLSAGSDLNDLTSDETYTLSYANRNDSNIPPSSSAVGVLEVKYDETTEIVYQWFVEMYTGFVYSRIKRATGWDEWRSFRKQVRILFVGNSLTQDGISYLPYLLRNYYPEISFEFYMWYNGGKTLGEQYEYFVNDTPCSIFSVAKNKESWTNYNNSKTMSSILASYKFDVVCLQEYFNYKDSYSESDLIDWNNCKDYITENYTGENPLEFISLFHAPLRSSADAVFARTVAANNLILQKTIADDLIPNGIAVYRALSTSLDNLGDQGHLSPDGTHTQEGLPCLLQTYANACWILDKIGLAKSIYGCPLRMTTDIYETLNVPGPNLGTGVITGTDAQNLLAQEVAIKAYKEGKYYVNNNIFLSVN